MADTFGRLVNPSHFVEDAAGVRAAAGATILVRSWPSGAALPDRLLEGAGHLPTFDAGVPEIRVSADGGVSWIGPLQSAEWTSQTRGAVDGKISRGEQVVSIMDHGAVGDGVTDDQAAWNAAFAATPEGGTLLLPAGRSFAIPAAVTINKTIRVLGYGATITKPTTSAQVPRWFTVTADRVHVEGVTFLDTGGRVTNTELTFGAPSRGGSATRCRFGLSGSIPLRIEDAHDTTLAHNTIDGPPEGIYVTGAATGARLLYNVIRGWQAQGIYLGGTTLGAPVGVDIIGNTIKDMKAGGFPRYPIHCDQSASPTRIGDVKVIGNTVLGPGKSYTAALLADRGTADQISIFFVDGLVVQGNVSRGGGDMGITIEKCTKVTCAGNVCTDNDVAGIAIFQTSRASVTGNTCVNNGRNRAGDRNNVGRAGIRVAMSATTGSSHLAIGQNTLGDDQVTKTQQYGVSLIGATNAVLGPDVDAGNALALYFSESGNTGLTKVSTVAL